MSVPLYGYLDLPAAGATIPAVGAVLAGWVFNGERGGQQPFTVRVRASEGTGLVDVPITRRLNAIDRPDVVPHFTHVAGMSRYTGFQLTLGAIPSGARTLTVEWSDAYGAQIDQVAVIVAA